MIANLVGCSMVCKCSAFMGNRCSRWVARHLVDTSTKTVLFPFSAAFMAPYLDQNSRPVIVTMGFIRAILPFAFSFLGSAIGRQLTFNTYKFASYRWQPVMSIMNFHQNEGVYQDIVLDPELEAYAHKIAVAIGHGKDPADTRSNLAALGFEVVGAGSGGLAVFRYELKRSKKVLILYITPYGPSILDEMPRYLVLERRHLYYTKKPDSAILEAATPSEESIHGFTYSGAFFNSQEWAALTTRFELELTSWAKACSRLGTQRYLKRGQSILYSPPNDLATLKQFIRSGHLGKKMKKDRKRWKEIQAEVKKMTKMVEQYQKEGTAPKRVILYLEGLDCSAKSSTGGLICEALENCGYGVKTSQHNRPPTPEQKQKPWMDRIRFEYPEDVYPYGEEIPEYAALVWDRGPGGDFVYGNFSELSQTEKKKKYEDFRTYDVDCREEGVLFSKFLFVTDKDSIASTLGKRLAHKKIVQDLRTWLDANSVAHAREALEAIEAHIDPTDFVAFNNYKQNTAKFTEFARNTDNVGHVGLQAESTIGYNNPWNVVNTSKRHPARLALLQAFEKQLKRYATTPENRISAADNLIGFFELDPIDDPVMRPFPNDFIEERDHGISFRAVLQSWLLVALLLFYAFITWKFDINDYA
jgi:polyphosphate kinase 2 (PPK2 family)